MRIHTRIHTHAHRYTHAYTHTHDIRIYPHSMHTHTHTHTEAHTLILLKLGTGVLSGGRDSECLWGSAGVSRVRARLHGPKPNALSSIIMNPTGLFEIGLILSLPSPWAASRLILTLSIALPRVDRPISGQRPRLGSADVLSEDHRKLMTTDAAPSAPTHRAVSVYNGVRITGLINADTYGTIKLQTFVSHLGEIVC